VPKIYFEGREFDSPEQMTPEARARYEKAVKMLPDRDENGIPDLLEGDGIPAAAVPPPINPAATGAEPEAISSSAHARRASQAVTRKGKWVIWVVIAVISLCIACFGIFMVGMFSIMRSSDAFKMALEIVKNHPTAQQVLGVPIEDSPFTTGSIEENGSSGTASLEIPIKGPNQSGKLYVTAAKEENTWRITSLMLEAGGQEYQLAP
jgi:hypothetical protein